jgi:hypothetical protein
MFSRGIVGLVAIALLAVVVSGGRAVLAQDATPAPFVPEGVTGVMLGSAAPSALPDHTLSLRLTTIQPGAVIPLHTHPGTLVVAVQSGSATVTVSDGTLVVTRAPVDGAPGVVEEFAAGDVTLLEVGDSMVEEGGQYIVENPNDVPAVVNFAVLTVTGAPVTDYLEH